MSGVDEIPDVVKPGEILDGKYLIEAQLGAGGMGMVVAGRNVASQQTVAIKLLFPAALANPEAVARFSREAKAAARIRSEHAVKMFDIGHTPNGAPYLVMERLEGADLSGVLGQRGPLPIELAADYLLQACEALAEAHVLGIVHRDLKSANLFLTRRPDGTPCVKVLDFGISKMLELDGGDGGTVLTATQTMMGSPAYMSPEQLVSAKRVDARSDIWGLGVIFYELISGALPFDGASMMQLFTSIARGEPAPLPPSVPREVAAVIFQCLQKSPADRLQDVAAFADAIAPFASPSVRASAVRRVRLNAATAAARAMPIDDEARTLLIDEPSNPAAARTVDETVTAQRRAVAALAPGGGDGDVAGVVRRRGSPLRSLSSPACARGGPSAGGSRLRPARTELRSEARCRGADRSADRRSCSASREPPCLRPTATAAPAPPSASDRAPRPVTVRKPRPRGADPFDTRN